MKKHIKCFIWMGISSGIACLILLVAMMGRIIEPIQAIDTSKMEEIPCESIVGEITEGTVIQQQFLLEEDELTSFAVRVATFSSVKDCKLFVELKDITENQVIQSWKVNAKGIGDNSFNTYILNEKLTDIKGHVFELTFTSDAVGGNAVTLWKNNACRYQGGLAINHENAEDQLVLGFNVLKSSSRINYIYLWIVSFFLVFFSYYVLKSKWRERCQGVFQSFLSWIRKSYKKILKLIGIELGLAFVVLGIELLISTHHWIEPNTAGLINEFRAAFSFVVLSTLVLFLFMHKDLEKKPENVFLICAFMIGCLYIYCLPSEVFVSWDEAIHYYRAVSLSHCISGKANAAEFWLYQNNGLRPENFKEISQLVEGQAMLQGLYDTGGTAAIQANYLKNIWIISYIPSAIALWIGRALHLPYTIIFYLGCLANLILYITLCYFSIKKVKSGKMIVVVVSLMTTAFFLAARYSYDTWVTGFYILGMAYFLAAMQRKQALCNREMVVMWGAFFFGSFAKTIYFPIMACLLLIPVCKFKTPKVCIQFKLLVLASMGGLAAGMILSIIYLPFIMMGIYTVCYMTYKIVRKWSTQKRIVTGGIVSIIGLAGGIAILYQFVPELLGVGDLRGGAVNASAQFLNILEHPIDFFKILWKFLSETYFSYESSQGWTYNLRSMAYLGLSNWKFIPVLFLIVVSITDKNEFDIWKRENTVRWSMVFVSIITVCMIATVLYISFTPYGSSEILGCQARYMIPLFFPVFSLIGSSRIQNQMNRKVYHGTVIAGSSALLFVNLWQCMVSLYY